MKKQRRVNRAKRLVAQPRFAARREQPAKGRGAYKRKRKHRQQVDDT